VRFPSRPSARSRFLVPAMGSHGRRERPKARKHLLESYGITEAFVGAPDSRQHGNHFPWSHARGLPGPPRQARLHGRSHRRRSAGSKARTTGYHGPIERRPAQDDDDRSWASTPAPNRVSPACSSKKPYGESPCARSVGWCATRAALAFWTRPSSKNAYDETWPRIAAVKTQRVRSTRGRAAWCSPSSGLARLPFPVGDLLVIDEIGKRTSAAPVMDTNVVGRKALRSAGNRWENQPQMRAHFHPRPLRNARTATVPGSASPTFTTNARPEGNELQGHGHQLPDGRATPRGANLPGCTSTRTRKSWTPPLAIIGTRPPEQGPRDAPSRTTLALEEIEISEALPGVRQAR